MPLTEKRLFRIVADQYQFLFELGGGCREKNQRQRIRTEPELSQFDIERLVGEFPMCQVNM